MKRNMKKGNFTQRGRKIKRSGKKRKMSDRAVCGYALLLCVVLMVMAVSLFAAFRDGKESQQTSGGVPEESEAAVKPKEEGSSDGPISFPKGIRDSVAAQEPQGDAKVVSCKILPDGEQFALKGETGELPESDDDNFYLVALKPYGVSPACVLKAEDRKSVV